MEPWLDSLSEDWKSEHRSSSPLSSIEGRQSLRHSSSSASQSRIPHLAENIRTDSSSRQYLKPRSNRGLAKLRANEVLSERSASSLNVKSVSSGPQKRLSSSTFPRRASEALSDYQSSIQRHSVRERDAEEDKPEWKRRLGNGDDVAGSGFDLFAPTKLEGIFNQPIPPKVNEGNESSFLEGLSNKNWKSFEAPSNLTHPDLQPSMRVSRNRLTGLEVLEEVNEEGEEEEMTGQSTRHLNSRTKISSKEDPQPNTRTEEPRWHAESMRSLSRQSIPDNMDSNQFRQDPRWRTVSGQEELKNEFISPITMSKQNSIREKMSEASKSIDTEALFEKLTQVTTGNETRPSSRSSDRAIGYGHSSVQLNHDLRDDVLGENTSHSLPEDLSMGTQDFISHGGYVNQKRGDYLEDSSFLQKNLSFNESSDSVTRMKHSDVLRSSPPSRLSVVATNSHPSTDSQTQATAPVDKTTPHKEPNFDRQQSSGSPLKLFGNRDTYTNNKLMRILSQYEKPELKEKSVTERVDDKQSISDGFRMSQFGQGDLDDFSFIQSVDGIRALPSASNRAQARQGIFQPQNIEQDAVVQERVASEVDEIAGSNTKALRSKPSSPNRTPKRRRTLIENRPDIPTQQSEAKQNNPEDLSKLAGKKRKDARPGDDGEQAEPQVLALRTRLLPKSSRRNSAAQDRPTQFSVAFDTSEGVDRFDEEDLTHALAAELASFAQESSILKTDSRKPSLATKDYMEEANKVMEFIRARGKPKTNLTEILEPVDLSELEPDAILDLDIDAESTKDEFSRPPSREGPLRPKLNQRQIEYDPKIESHLQKYKDEEDLDLLTNSLINGTFGSIDHESAYEASLIPIPTQEQESSPPNIRIRGPDGQLRKRKHSTSTLDQVPTYVEEGQIMTLDSSDSSTRRTFPTTSSGGSGQKGIITSGTVSIPDQVGMMTFDHERKIWFKKVMKPQDQPTPNRRDRGTLSEEDPFENIPDLSFDDKKEGVPKKTSSFTGPKDQTRQSQNDISEHENKTNGFDQDEQGSDLTTSSVLHQQLSLQEEKRGHKTGNDVLPSEASKHEEMLHNGIVSKPPFPKDADKKHPRVVTIGFSSPLVSAINYQPDLSAADTDLDEDDSLQLGDSDELLTPVHGTKDGNEVSITLTTPIDASSMRKDRGREQYQAMMRQRKSISRIDEIEEDVHNGEMSLVHISQATALAPANHKEAVYKSNFAGNKASSILCLTPLSEFSVHQIDSRRHPEQSYVEERPNPKALRHAHGSLALAVDELVKAITDAESTELYWEHIQRLSLANKGLSTLHTLQEYCPSLEDLSIADNRIAHLAGLPSTLRVLDIHANSITNLTSWSHLQNLQYVDISSNQLESLEGLHMLVHLRSLKANNNKIREIEGIFDLDGLLEIQLSGNNLIEVDFEGAELNRLRRLDLSHNQIEAIQNLDCLPSLEELDLGHNHLMQFVESHITAPARLKKLCLAHNKIELLDLTGMSELRELDLDHNRIRDIKSLEKAYKLENLSLRSQYASPHIIDTVLSSINECRRLALSSNMVPGGFLRIPPLPQCNLRELEIAGCGISELPAGFGDYFPNCRKLNINFNAIKDLSHLQGMHKLNELNVAKNRIQRLRRTCVLLSRLNLLSVLDLRDNPLTVGFYGPTMSDESRGCAKGTISYTLPKVSGEQDKVWLPILDEITKLRRHTMELMLAERCKYLTELDGMVFDRVILLKEDNTWQTLTQKKILMKPAQQSTLDCEESTQPVADAVVYAQVNIPGHDATR